MEALQRLHMGAHPMPFGLHHPDQAMMRANVGEERKSPMNLENMSSTIINMGNDAVRLSGVSETISAQIQKYDSSEFDDDKDTSTQDAEGVWAPEIEQSFMEALAIYPPCGRRKIILSDEGKMYGRNELIARYIKLRTGKTRTRKQVSSHIQVLARRKLREIQAKLKVPSHHGGDNFFDSQYKENALKQMQQMSSAQIVSASVMHKQSLMGGLHHPAAHPTVSGYPQFWQPALHHPVHSQHEDIKPFAHHFPPHLSQPHPHPQLPSPHPQLPSPHPQIPSPHLVDTKPPPVMAPQPPPSPPWLTRSIATSRLRLLEHSAYVENQSEQDSYQKHLFVHIGSAVSYSDPPLEPVDVRQIQDKFPEKSDGLKELYGKGPQDAFFLVKFWADLNMPNTYDSNPFYGVSAT